MKKVMCFGTFDLLHLGHIDYFKQAKKYGDNLVVVIARDRTKELQQQTATFLEEERRELIGSLKIVDEAVLGDVEDHFKIISDVKPDVICLGYDHVVKEEDLWKELEKRGLHLKIYRMKAYKTDRHKGSKLREKILKL
jgi:FAD synthetase